MPSVPQPVTGLITLPGAKAAGQKRGNEEQEVVLTWTESLWASCLHLGLKVFKVV